MSKLYPLLFILFFSPGFVSAQTLTGIWQGYFYPDMASSNDTYKYEVQLNHISNKSVKGVTYSYLQKSFYGKADLQGMYMESTRNLIIKEEKLVEVKPRGSSAQIMTCYLTYSKIGNTEYLNGTYSSVSTENGAIGRNGKVFLQRTDKTDFSKEPFLVKRKVFAGSGTQSKPSGNNTGSISKNPGVSNTSPNVRITVPGKLDTSFPERNITASEKIQNPIPPVLKDRENKLVRKIVTNSPDINIELYDNGEIDGDIITVYHNYQLIVNKKGLTRKPITVKVTASATDSLHEFILVADNLGTIPPNTALMVITTGSKRYELFIGTDERRNAKVIVEYNKPQ